MHFFENTKGWHQVYEDGPYSLCQHCLQMYLSANFPGYLLEIKEV
jgi:hypothetical protein